LCDNLVLLEGIHEGGDYKDQHPDDSNDRHDPAPDKARASHHAVDGVDA